MPFLLLGKSQTTPFFFFKTPLNQNKSSALVHLFRSGGVCLPGLTRASWNVSLSLSIQGGQAGSSPSATVGIFMEIVDATNCALPSQQHTCSHPPPRTSLVHTFSYSFKSNPIRAPACYAWEHRDHLFHLSIETFAIYCGWRFFGVNFTVPPCNLEWYLRGL